MPTLKRTKRTKPGRSYVMSDKDYEQQITKQLPYSVNDDWTIDNASDLILYALRKLPRKK